MAPRRRIHGGKSWGRSQSIIGIALDQWEEIGAWCLLNGQIHLWKVPSYQFAGLVIAWLKDDKTEESLKKIDQAFEQADEIIHPFLTVEFRRLVKSMGDIMPSIKARSAVTIDNVVYDSRLTDLPIEERKRQEAKAKGKPYRVPEWWRGERANYQVAKQMMVTLPKKGGKPIKDK